MLDISDDLREHCSWSSPARDGGTSTPGRARCAAGRDPSRLHPPPDQSEAAVSRSRVPGHRHLSPRGGSGQVGGERGIAADAAAGGDRRRCGVRRSGGRHRRQDPDLRQDEADHQPAQLSRDAGEPGGDPCAAGQPRRRRHQDRHDGQRAARQRADAATGRATAQIPTVGICMGEIGDPVADSGRQVRRPVHLLHVPSRADAGARAAELLADEGHLPLRRDQRRTRRSTASSPIRSGQSIVPIVHNAAFRALGINSVCVPFRVPREYLSSFLHDSSRVGSVRAECGHAAPR